MPNEDSKQFLKGAFVLAAAAFFVKILSAVYRVPFQNIVGDVGFYIYQQVYPIYGLAAVLATSGFPVIVSRIAAENDGKAYLKQRVQAAFLAIALAGTSLFALTFFGAGLLAGWMGDPLLAPLIRIVSYVFLLLPFLSLWRGLYQGSGKMLPPAASQMAEQAVRVGVILFLSSYLVRHGYSLYAAGQGALAGSLAGGAAGAAVLAAFALKHRSLWPVKLADVSFSEIKKTGRIVLLQGTAICLSSLLLILFQFADSLFLYSRMVISGIDPLQAKALKGVFDRGQPLIQLGTVTANALSLALVPMVASSWKQCNQDVLKGKVLSALKWSVVIGAGASAGLFNIIKPVNIMLFKTADGSLVLGVLGLSIFFSSILITAAGVLQGMGHVYAPARYMLLGLGIKAAGNWLLIPEWGTMGAAVSTLLGLLAASFFVMKKLNAHLGMGKAIKNMLLPIAMAAAAMTAVLQLWLLVLQSAGLTGRLWSTAAALLGVAAGGAVYLSVIFKGRVFTEEESGVLPYGKRVYRFFHKHKGRPRP
ncbi:MAG TPA: polysaccharide biosynthesis protein [Bacillaceae bacterium]